MADQTIQQGFFTRIYFRNTCHFDTTQEILHGYLLVKAHIETCRRGFMDYAFTLASQSSGMTRDDIADLAVMSIQGELMQFPDIADLIIPPIERFIQRGGRIVVSAEPTFSLPIISYLPLMESPSDAINVLGVRVTN